MLYHTDLGYQLCGNGTRAVLLRSAAGVLTRQNMGKKQTTVYYDCKQFVPRFFLYFCTCLILGFRPTNQTTQHDDSSRSRHVTFDSDDIGYASATS